MASQLNPQQAAAVRHEGAPLLVLAGAGSGKTRVITEKIVRLVRDRQVEPRQVYAVTFTNKAAREMKQRLGTLLGPQHTAALSVSTFHNLGLRLLREECGSVGLRRNLSIFDGRDSLALIEEIVAEVGCADVRTESLRWQISHWKNELISPTQALDTAADALERTAAETFARYQELLTLYNACDFDDLIAHPVSILRSNTELREKWRARIACLLIDEYQDTNDAQYAMVRELAGDGAGLTVVGDDDQSIYAWRGARPENLSRLNADFPGLTVIKLEQNYRSFRRILAVANRLIANNAHLFEKRLWSDLGHGDRIRVLNCRDPEDEARRVAAEIVTYRFRHRCRYDAFAVLYRGNHQSRAFERALREHKVPYQVSGGSAFFERQEIRDLLAYLRVLVNPLDDAAALRIINTPRREIGPATLERLSRFARERALSLVHACVDPALPGALAGRALCHVQDFGNWLVLLADNAERGDPMANVRQLLDDIDYADWLRDTSATPPVAAARQQAVDELLDWLTRLATDSDGKDRSLAALVAQISLFDMLERNDGDDATDAVQLMTLHSAKGLEFDHVHMVGMEESILPHHASLEGEALAEERRLAYVGLTRARRSLTLSHASQRQRQGEWMACTPSRFLGELPADDLEWEGRTIADPEEQLDRGRSHLADLRSLLGET